MLTFYEEVNEAEISSNDFDILTEILRKQHLSKKVQTREHTPQREGSGGENDNVTIYNEHRKKLKKMLKKRNEKCLCMNAAELSMLQDVKAQEPATPLG